MLIYGLFRYSSMNTNLLHAFSMGRLWSPDTQLQRTLKCMTPVLTKSYLLLKVSPGPEVLVFGKNLILFGDYIFNYIILGLQEET